ncbi:MAG: hypothetical protein AAGF73_15595 [Actinomycetota bacterium]
MGTQDSGVTTRTWMAVLALVLACVWLGGLGSVAAVVLSVVVLRDAPTRSQRQISIAALTIGLIGLLGTILSFALLVGSSTS